jgi:ketosteroid isomerase-like protein
MSTKTNPIMTAQDTRKNGETEIRQVVADWLRNVCAKDVDRLMSHYAADVSVFSVRPLLRIKGVSAVASRVGGGPFLFSGLLSGGNARPQYQRKR